MIDFLKSETATVLSWLINALIVVFIFIMKNMFVEQKSHTKLEKRVSTIETTMKSLPNIDEMHSLSLSIKELTGDLNVVEERLKNFHELSDRMQKQLDLMDRYLRRLDNE